MREIAVDGVVRRVEHGEYTAKNGAVVPTGTIVLASEFDRLEVSLDRGVSAGLVAKLKSIGEGEVVRLLVGVASGDSFRADPRFIFLDNLTVHGK